MDFSFFTAWLDRLEAKLDRLIKGEEALVLTQPEAMKLLGSKSSRSFYRLTAELGIKPYSRGRYLRADLESAMASRAIRLAAEAKNAALNRQVAVDSEVLTEGRHKISAPNPQDD